MANEILEEINKIDEKICDMKKAIQNMPHDSTMKVFCIEIIKALDIREHLCNKLKD